jgi:hypothetical protein
MATANYSGWNLLEEVIIVQRQKQEINVRAPKGYLVDPTNKASLKSAMDWGKGYQHEGTGDDMVTRTIEPIVHRLKNQGFRIALDTSPSSSSQGGKLAFCMCTITQGDLTFSLGINTALLIEAMKQSTIINGQFQEEFVVARAFGNVGILHSGMKEYQQAMQDIETKKAISKKISKHVVGKSYKTIQEENLYLGDAYLWLAGSGKYTGYSRSRANGSLYDEDGITLLKTPKTVKFFPNIRTSDDKTYIGGCYDGGILADDVKNTKDIWDKFEELCVIPIITEKKGYLRPQNTFLMLIDTGINNKITDKLPSRAVGDYSFENNSGSDRIEQAILAARKRFEDAVKNDDAVRAFNLGEALAITHMTASIDTRPAPLTPYEIVGLRYLVRQDMGTPLAKSICDELNFTAAELREMKRSYPTGYGMRRIPSEIEYFVKERGELDDSK